MCTENPLERLKKELFEIIVNSSKLLLIFAKSSILDVCLGSEYASNLDVMKTVTKVDSSVYIPSHVIRNC